MTQRDLRALPKAHLHLHLEGAMRQSTLRELTAHYRVAAPIEPDGTFATFIAMYRAACEVLRTPDDVVRLVREVAQDAVNDGAVWVEPAEWLTADQAARLGMPHEEAVLELILDAARAAERDVGIGVGVMVSSNRTRPVAEAMELARLGARYAGRGVVAFGLADDETVGPPEEFAEPFDVARQAGLISAPHAGEHGGPDSIRGALDALGARRIEHGVRAVEDAALLERLAADSVCLDVCPTSNVQLHVVASYEQHPLGLLLDAWVQVSLNADDPVFFGSGLLEEYQLARDRLGLDDERLASIAAASIRASGAPPSLKQHALEGVSAWLSQ
jgi:adenosine deaminase